MRLLLTLILTLFPAIASAQNLSASTIRLVPGPVGTCPTGRVCIIGTSASSPARVAFQDGAGNQINMGDSWYLRLSAGAPVSPTNGWIWYDTTANAVYVRVNGANVPLTNAGDKAFFRACTLTSAAAATPVTCLADADVPVGQKAYTAGIRIKVNGATAWATTTLCTVEDSAGVDLLTIPVASLTGNALLTDASGSVTVASAMALGSGTTTATGLRVVCDANGTGSDLVISTWGTVR